MTLHGVEETDFGCGVSGHLSQSVSDQDHVSRWSGLEVLTQKIVVLVLRMIMK